MIMMPHFQPDSLCPIQIMPCMNELHSILRFVQTNLQQSVSHALELPHLHFQNWKNF